MWTTKDTHPLHLIAPIPPLLPEPEPPFIQISYDYRQLKRYRLQSQPYAVQVSYDTVQLEIESGILEQRVRDYIRWIEWVAANL